ncbi:MAG: recombinase family protein [Myxococcales bacterium]|nr:recombinase family protein [Myxococcales bacterium]
MNRKAAVYLRVSRGEQSLDNQLPDLKRLARARKLRVVETFEESVSATGARPEFKKMMEAAHRGAFEVLLVWSLDRLGRSMTGNLQAVLDLDRCGVEVLSVREPWLDTGGPVRPLLIAIFGWVAEQERAQISERTKAGLARARKKGVRLGRPKRRVDQRRAERLRAKGMSFRAIANQLGVPLSTLHRALRSKKGSDSKGS